MKIQYLTVVLLFASCNDSTSSRRNVTEAAPVVSEVDLVYSGIQRDKGTAPLTYKQETAANSVGSSIRAIPDVRFDDEGSDGKNSLSRSSLSRPTTPCGHLSTDGLAAKIADCALPEKNGVLSLWNGSANATSAETTWKLVTLSNVNSSTYEVWVDTRTGMLWSGIIGSASNWCASSGNVQSVSDEIGVDCVGLGRGASACTLLSLAELPKAKWRLPSRTDFLQADVDGLRFVVPKGSAHLWSATISSETNPRSKAWSYDMGTGTVQAEAMTTELSVRCIGVANF